ncbi:MAG: class III extradiol dioxygenase subunit B-like domain-containing protein [Patescibacteria group bacterium]|nr:class III extradiol dioxygenase subunit B-like domain-containing protein [Patescibacteria group bacterium]
MSIVFAAITPHPPILIPAIGKENLSKLKNTSEAYQELEESLYVREAETIIIISPHGLISSGSFTMNLSPEFILSFEDFGDLVTKMKLVGDIGLAYKIRESLETKAPLQLISEPNLDHGSGVPLFLLAQGLKNANFQRRQAKIIPLYYCGLDLEAHFQFGQLLKKELLASKNRIGVIASGDLSHRLTKDAPAGYSRQGAKFDKKLIEYLKNKKTSEIIKMNEKLISDAGECGLKSIAILLGILDGIKYEPRILSYEGPFGVGYLTAEFIFD